MIFEDFKHIRRLLGEFNCGGGYSIMHSLAERQFHGRLLPFGWDLPEPLLLQGTELAASLAKDPSDGSYTKA